jgi:secondary thiamine-phosphate synthase enzyme
MIRSPRSAHDGERHAHSPVRTAPDQYVVRRRRLSIESRRPFECIDITAPVAALVRQSGLDSGVAVVQTLHTTTGVMINEHEPGLLADLEAMFERLAPVDLPYAHDDLARRTVNLMPGERRNGHAHCRAALLRTSETLGVACGELGLGRWQRLFLVELDGGQRRQLLVTLVGTLDEEE